MLDLQRQLGNVLTNMILIQYSEIDFSESFVKLSVNFRKTVPKIATRTAKLWKMSFDQIYGKLHYQRFLVLFSGKVVEVTGKVRKLKISNQNSCKFRYFRISSGYSGYFLSVISIFWVDSWIVIVLTANCMLFSGNLR